MKLEENEKRRKHIVVLSAYRFWPVQDGGHQRNWNLYVELEDKFDITVVAIDWSGESKFSETEGGSQLISFSPPNEVVVSARLLAPQVGFHSWDMLTTLFSQQFDHLDSILGKLNMETDLVILSRPWLAPLLVNFPQKPVILDLHDVETDFLNRDPREIQEFTNNLQNIAISLADTVTLCSQRDLDSIKSNDSDKYFVISNGFKEVEFKAESTIKKCGVIFVGSGHKPNVDACQRLYKIAKLLPNFHFLIIGSVSNHPELSNPPANVKLMGFLELSDLQSIFQTALCFLNPMDGGSGSSLKIAQALSFGLPIVSTEFGMRGFENLSDDAWLCAERDQDFAHLIEKLGQQRDLWLSLSESSKKQAILFDWRNIRRDFTVLIDDLLLQYIGTGPKAKSLVHLVSMNQALKRLSIEAVQNLNKDLKTILRNLYKNLPEWMKRIILSLIDMKIVRWIVKMTFSSVLNYLKLSRMWSIKREIGKVNQILRKESFSESLIKSQR